MPPFCIALAMLASPVPTSAIPQSSDRPNPVLLADQPTATRPVMLSVSGAMTAATPIAHPLNSDPQHKAMASDIPRLIIVLLLSTSWTSVPAQDLSHVCLPRSRSE